MKRVFKANDGTEFETLAECRTHENKSRFDALIGLTKESIDGALHGDVGCLYIADALEKAGIVICQKRRQEGNFRRNKSRNGGLIRSRFDDRPSSS